jgi:periplasmic protein TonB
MRIVRAVITSTLLFASTTAGSAAAGKPVPTPRPTRTVEAVKVPLKAPVRSIESLEQALASPDPALRAEAASELAGAGTVPEAVANRLKEALQGDADPRVRAAAVWAYAHVRQGIAQPDAGLALQPVPFDEPPKLVKNTPFAYPPAAFDQGIEGTVRVELVIDEEGKVARAEVRESVPELDAAAVASMRQWLFTPARKAGKPIVTVVSVPMEFKIRTKTD